MLTTVEKLWLAKEASLLGNWLRSIGRLGRVGVMTAGGAGVGGLVYGGSAALNNMFSEKKQDVLKSSLLGAGVGSLTGLTTSGVMEGIAAMRDLGDNTNHSLLSDISRQINADPHPLLTPEDHRTRRVLGEEPPRKLTPQEEEVIYKAHPELKQSK